MGSRAVAGVRPRRSSSRTTTTNGVSLSSTTDACLRNCAWRVSKLGWKFVGPTTVYAFMQAMGLINDHVEGCVIRPKVERVRAAFVVPS